MPNLPFQVPTAEDGTYAFSGMSTEDLTSIRSQAREAAAQYAEMDVSDVSGDDIETMRELTTIVQGVDKERTRRSGAAGSFAALTDALGDEDETGTDAATDGAGAEGTGTPETPVATTTAAAAKPTAPGVAAVASRTTPAVPAEQESTRVPAVILAGANNSDYPVGAELDWTKVGKLVEKRFLQYGAGGGGGGARRDPVAQFKLEYPQELTASGGLQEDATAVIDYAASEKRLPGGSLLASVNLARKKIEAQGGNSLTAAGAGWCAPSEVIYDLCELESSDGMLDIPEINVSRGGIKFTTGPDFSSIYSGSGYFHYTESQIISGVTKPTMAVPCPSFTDVRLEADGLAIQADLLQLRGYPELIARFVRGAMVAHTHKINQFMINALVTGSTALNLPSAVASHTPGQGTTWFTDHSVVTTLLTALDMAIMDYKYRQRMTLNATLEVVFPYWVLAWIRSDIARKNFYDTDATTDQFNLTMERINTWLTARGARAQYVYDWQDAFYWAAYPSGAPSAWQQFGASPTSTDFVQDFPHTLQFLLYAAGTWVRGNADIITLDTVYDSTLLAQNKTTQLFTEQGILAAKTCFDSRVYTIGNLPGGLIPTGAGAYALTAQATGQTAANFPSNP